MSLDRYRDLVTQLCKVVDIPDANAVLDRGWGKATQPMESGDDRALVIHRIELRADFQHLRRWRKSVEQAQSYTFKAVITIIVTGFLGAVWLGIKTTLGK